MGNNSLAAVCFILTNVLILFLHIFTGYTIPEHPNEVLVLIASMNFFIGVYLIVASIENIPKTKTYKSL